MDELIKYMLPLVGVIIGASLQYMYSVINEKRRHNRTIRMNSYLEYLTAIGEMEALQFNPDYAVMAAAQAKAISAKAKVCAYGTGRAVKALSKFERIVDGKLTDEKKLALIAFVNVIRDESGVADVDISREILEPILYGSGRA